MADYSLSDPAYRAYDRIRFHRNLTNDEKRDYITFCNGWCNVIDATVPEWEFCRANPDERKLIERKKVNYRTSYIFARQKVDSAIALRYAQYREDNNLWTHRGDEENLEEWMK